MKNDQLISLAKKVGWSSLQDRKVHPFLFSTQYTSIMKITSISKKCFYALAIALVLFAATDKMSAAPLTYSGTGPFSWNVDTWTTPSVTWTSGDSATFSNTSAAEATLTASTAIAGLSKSGSGTLNIIADGTPRTLTFSGGNINSGNTIQISDYVNIQGNFNNTGARLLHQGNNRTAYSGTGTISSGSVVYTNAAQVGSGSNFVVSGGTLTLEMGATANMGTVQVNSGSWVIGRDGNNAATSATISSLSGNGGAVNTAATASSPQVRLLTINQSTDTAFAGAINGSAGSGLTLGQIQFTKQGAGNLTLSGNVTLGTSTANAGTTVEGGGLFINSNTTSFTRSTGGSVALAVNGSSAILGGTGTITVQDGRSVGINSINGGRLAAGLLNTAGRTTYHFNDGGQLSLAGGVSKGNDNWLLFDLGSAATAGTTYDQIRLTLGTLNLGAGLEFTDFSFNALAGFGPGTYTLFETPSSILGTLGTTLTGTISGFESTLSLSLDGTDLVLSVIPEPSTSALLMAGAGVFLYFRNRKNRRA